MSVYTFSISENFGNYENLNTQQLGSKINDNSLGLIKVEVNGDVLTLLFLQSLTTEQETILNTIVANHSPVTQLIQGKFTEFYVNFTPFIEFTSAPSDTACAYYRYVGTLASPDAPTKGIIVHNGYYSGTDTNYEIDVMLRDLTNNTMIFNESITGDSGTKTLFYPVPQVYTISSLSNLPEREAMFELVYKLKTGVKGRLYLVHMY